MRTFSGCATSCVARRTSETETDTEVMVHVLTAALDSGPTPEEATRAMLARVEGAFAFAILFAGRDDLLVAMRRGNPLAIGCGEGEMMYLGSDAMALAPLMRSLECG